MSDDKLDWVRLEEDVDWDVVADIIHDAYRGIAPRKLVDQLDARDSLEETR